MDFNNNQFNQFCGYIPIVCKKRQSGTCLPCDKTKQHKTCTPCPPCPTLPKSNDEYNTPEGNTPRAIPPIDSTPRAGPPRDPAVGDDVIDKTISDFLNIPPETVNDNNDNDEANSTWDTAAGIVHDVFNSENPEPPVVEPPTGNDPVEVYMNTYTELREFLPAYSDIGPSPVSSDIFTRNLPAVEAWGKTPNQSPDAVLPIIKKLSSSGYSEPADTILNSRWDGIPIQNPNSKTKAELCAILRPVHQYLPLGIYDLYHEIEPFADENNPTPREIVSWELEVIKHFRRLFGVADKPVEPDARLFLQSTWLWERNKTSIWDTKYPGPGTKAGGPCVGTQWANESHCGTNFFPDAVDRNRYISQAPYNNDFQKYPELESWEHSYKYSENMLGSFHFLPWSLKMAWALTNMVCLDGMTGHSNPVIVSGLTQQYMGWSWWYEEETPTKNAYFWVKIQNAGGPGNVYPLEQNGNYRNI